MTELLFIKVNIERWKKFEAVLVRPSQISPDELAGLYSQVTDDLAYARTFYKNSQTEKYLNDLAIKSHGLLYKNKKENWQRIFTFWQYELPLVIYQSRKNIFYALAIFVLAVAIGVISASTDDTFVRIILGDRYVNTTIANIERGDPMAIYKSQPESSMFVGISLNNVKVALMAFALGALTAAGAGYVLFFNGIMLGSFQYFFYSYGVFYESVLSIWIHGTLEIWAIIVSGAAGFMVGSSFMFPGSFSRVYSFRKGALLGLKLVIGVVPVFIFAALLEGYVTRLTDMPDWSRFGIILASLAFIIWYFYIYPIKINQLLHGKQ